jgi:hypothetical protein
MAVLDIISHSSPQDGLAPWSYCALEDCGCSLPKACLLDDEECTRLKVCAGSSCECDRPKICLHPHCDCGRPKVITSNYGNPIRQ